MNVLIWRSIYVIAHTIVSIFIQITGIFRLEIDSFKTVATDESWENITRKIKNFTHFNKWRFANFILDVYYTRAVVNKNSSVRVRCPTGLVKSCQLFISEGDAAVAFGVVVFVIFIRIYIYQSRWCHAQHSSYSTIHFIHKYLIQTSVHLNMK